MKVCPVSWIPTTRILVHYIFSWAARSTGKGRSLCYLKARLPHRFVLPILCYGHDDHDVDDDDDDDDGMVVVMMMMMVLS